MDHEHPEESYLYSPIPHNHSSLESKRLEGTFHIQSHSQSNIE